MKKKQVEVLGMANYNSQSKEHNKCDKWHNRCSQGAKLING